MSTLDDYDLPLSKMESLVSSWVEEGLELRHGDAGDPGGSIDLLGAEAFPDEDVLDLLSRVRKRHDRVNGLQAMAVKERGRARRAAEAAKFAAENRYDEAMQKRSLRRRDFESAKATHADAALDSLDDRRTAHKAARYVSVTQDACDVLGQIDWQLNSMRTELREILRSRRFDTHLDH